MEGNNRKRMASDEPSVEMQRKRHLNEKIFNANNEEKMKEIHAKTLNMLFEAARKWKPDALQSRRSALSYQIILTGDGKIHCHPDENPDDLSMQQQISRCCDRKTYVQDKCSNCDMPLCEECGYSCIDCGKFLCRSCVTMFGCGTEDRPVCEDCMLYL